MSITVHSVTETVCDQCGMTSSRDGAHHNHCPIGWAYIWFGYETGEESPTGLSSQLYRVLCPICAQQIEAVLRPGSR